MTPAREFFLMFFIGGYLLLLEGIVAVLVRWLKDSIPEYGVKIIAGFAISILSLVVALCVIS